MYKHILLLFSFICITTAFSQNGEYDTKSKKAIKYVEQGMAQSRNLNENRMPDYAGGIPYFDKAIEKDPNFTYAYMVKADYAMRCGRNDLAIEAYRKVIEIKPNITKTGYIYFDLAMLEWNVGEYAQALVHAKKFKTFPSANPESLKEVEWLIVNCTYAAEAVKNPLDFNPVNIGTGVNTADAEYFPALTVDQKELLFTRRVTASNGYEQEDFFISADLNGYWNLGKPMPKNINTPLNEGAPTFAPDGRTLIFVGCADPRYAYGEGRRGYGSCDLFVTEKIGDRWTDPINLPGAVNSVNWETQPSLSSDGKTLYFIRGSVRGTGGRNKRNGDIYVSKLEDNGTWGVAEKLPSNINTPYSESSVHIHPDGKTLYFSSNGHVGMGGYDLYMTTLQPDGSWSDPKNLGYPINTSNNEGSLLVYAEGDIAIIGSDRPGGLGRLDLYTFEMPESIRPTKTIYMTGTVFDAKTKAKLGAEFSLIDLETGEEVVRSFSDPKNGKFLVSLPINKDYALLVNKTTYLPFSVNFNLTVPENSTKPYEMDVPLQPTYSDEAVTLANVFFDLGSFVLRKESFVELDKLVNYLNANPELKIELQGHTDAQGDDQKNMTLSDNRANSVRQYLIDKGVKPERLTAKGYGETIPNTKDVNGEAISLTEAYINALPAAEQKAAHQLNRRTMYKIIRK